MQKTKFEFSSGNFKYSRKGRSERKVTDHNVMIINQGTATECPSYKLGMCQIGDKKNCYAYQAEQRYPLCFPYRRRQEMQWKKLSVMDFIDQIYKVQSKKSKKFTHLRFAESGDFNRTADILKLASISGGVKCQSNMETFTYTARRDLIDDRILAIIEKTPLVINGSGFMAHNEYKIVPADYKPKHKKEVWCPDKCYNCKLCKVRGGFTILSKIRDEYYKAAMREENRKRRKEQSIEGAKHD